MGKWKNKVKSLTRLEYVRSLDIQGRVEQMYTFAMYALGLKSINDFDLPENDYSEKEIGKIAEWAIKDADKGKNPTK